MPGNSGTRGHPREKADLNTAARKSNRAAVDFDMPRTEAALDRHRGKT